MDVDDSTLGQEIERPCMLTADAIKQASIITNGETLAVCLPSGALSGRSTSGPVFHVYELSSGKLVEETVVKHDSASFV